jgi:hypothetical protein
MKFLIAIVVASSALAFNAQLASAGTVHVETTGADSGTCGAIASPCLTIAQGTTNAVSGDTVAIGSGTFTQTASINPGVKSIEYIGAGPNSTIVTAASSTTFPAAGLFSFRSAGATVAVRDLEITGFPGTAAVGSRYGIWVQPNPANLASAISATVENVNVVGLGAVVAGVTENAVYAANNSGPVTITDSTLTGVMGNSLLFENQRGAVNVSSNTITKPLTSNGAVIYDMLHAIGATAWDQTGLHSFTDNSITAIAAINVIGGFTPTNTLGASAFPIGVTITGNAIDTSTSTSSAISLINAANDNTGTSGRIDNAIVSGNTIVAGSGGGPGITLQGGIPSPVIDGNNLRNRSSALSLTRRTQTASPFTTWDHKPTTVTASANQIVDNTTGVSTDSGVPITADLNGNWWGCNEGPVVSNISTPGDCDSVATFDSSTVSADEWIVLGIAASPASDLPSTGVATTTAGFGETNLGNPAPQAFTDGQGLPMSATGGTLATPTPPLAAGLAANTFTSTGATGRTVSASFDNEAVTFAWPDADASPPVITITSPASGAVVDAPTITLNYTVNESASCTPPSGSTVNLAVGSNTIVVTCTDAAGNVGTASVVVVRPDALPECARDVVITGVSRSGSQSRVSGYARLKYAGQRISLQYQPSGSRTIARPTVRSDGSWSVTVHRPSNPAYNSNSARYRASLNKSSTAWIKLTRRMGTTTVTSAGNGILNVNGRVGLPLAPGQRLRVERSDSCGQYHQVGSLRVFGSGSFGGQVSDGGGSTSAVFIRLRVSVRSSTNPNKRFTTYSIVTPVVLKR